MATHSVETIFIEPPHHSVQIRWRGGATFNVYLATHDRRGGENDSGWSCIDCFTVYGDAEGNPPTANQAKEIAAEHFTQYLA